MLRGGAPNWLSLLAWLVVLLIGLHMICSGIDQSLDIVLQWRHTERDGVSNHKRLECLLNRLFKHISKKTLKLRFIGFVRGIHRWPVDSPQKRPVTRKWLHSMTPSWWRMIAIYAILEHIIKMKLWQIIHVLGVQINYVVNCFRIVQLWLKLSIQCQIYDMITFITLSSRDDMMCQYPLSLLD